MPKADRAGAGNLSGVWHGQYSYPRNRAPVDFAATLTENNSWLHGVTQETGTVGDARGLTISATLQGRRTGRSVTWLKFYHGSYRGYDAVQYAGEVNEDGTEIEGRWIVSGSWSGRFMMIRSKDAAVERSREVTEKVRSR
jgi:hypothetical protein